MIPLAHLSIEAVKGPLSEEAVDRGIISFQSFIEWVSQLPVQQNTNNTDFKLVFDEECGSFDTKHALIKAVAAENEWDQIELFIGLYRMSAKTNRVLADVLRAVNIDYLPQLYTYLTINGSVFDLSEEMGEAEVYSVTGSDAVKIEPHELGEYLINVQRNVFEKWCLKENGVVEDYWMVREKCITLLASDK